MWRSFINWFIRLSSLVVVAKARYSASTEERDTILCFFAFEDINASLMNMQKLVVHFWESMHDVQSTSLNAFKYRKSTWTESKCVCRGWATCWLNLCTAKVMFGRETVRCRSLPMRHLYADGSESISPESDWSFRLGCMGKSVGLEVENYLK